MLNPDPQQYPKLKVLAEDIITLEHLVEVLEQRVTLVKKDKPVDEKTINENKITIIKTELEVRSFNKMIEEKKTKYEGLIGALENILPELESNFDSFIEKAKVSDNEKIREYGNLVPANAEGKLDLYLILKDAFSKEQGKPEGLKGVQ